MTQGARYNIDARRLVMGFFSDFFWGTSSAGGSDSGASKKGSGFFGGYDNSVNGYDGYYKQVHNDALWGDPDAAAEMRDEFGDDWEGEY